GLQSGYVRALRSGSVYLGELRVGVIDRAGAGERVHQRWPRAADSALRRGRRAELVDDGRPSRRGFREIQGGEDVRRLRLRAVAAESADELASSRRVAGEAERVDAHAHDGRIRPRYHRGRLGRLLHTRQALRELGALDVEIRLLLRVDELQRQPV